MKTVTFDTVAERAFAEFTHLWTVTYKDLNDTAGLTKTLSLLKSLDVGDLARDFAFLLVTPFTSSGAATSLLFDVGYNLSVGVDDPDAFLDAYEVLAAGRTIAGDGNGAVFASLRTGYAFQVAADIEVLFTATGANLNTLTAGELRIFANITKLANIR